MCRYQYIDFLHYPWVAQMVNQFEDTQIYIFLNLEVLPCPDSKLQRMTESDTNASVCDSESCRITFAHIV